MFRFVSALALVFLGLSVVPAAHAQSILGPVPTLSEIIEAGSPKNEGHLFGPVPTLSEIIDAGSQSRERSGILGPVPCRTSTGYISEC